MQLEFSGPIVSWRGPAPYHFVAVPEAECGMIAAASELVTYGWGMVPVAARIGSTEWTTSLWPRDGGYVVPLKADVRRAETLELGDTTRVRLTIDA